MGSGFPDFLKTLLKTGKWSACRFLKNLCKYKKPVHSWEEGNFPSQL
jgi:hypothetical protein